MRLRTVCLFLTSAIPASGADAGTKVDFARDVQPLLQQKCGVCHGAKQHLAGLRLDDRDSAKRVIQPGHASDSKIIDMVKGASGKVMPPMGAKLTDDQIALLTRWIDQGANWPASASASRHWAWEPVQHPAAPAVKRGDWPGNDIDKFVLARLEKEGIAPSADADKATLLRRVSIDITGLPPTPQETAEFLADQRPDAYARQVDRLLASSHYGEKWSRAWLDLAHYADSDGFEKDLIRPWSWRYRDWVINAYNRDMPYDRVARSAMTISTIQLNSAISTKCWRISTPPTRRISKCRCRARSGRICGRVRSTKRSARK